MKKNSIYVLALFAVTSVLISCSKDSTRAEDQQRAEEITSAMREGTWRITSFKDDRVDHTAMFDGYTFTFDNNNNVTATLAGTNHMGTWSITIDNDDRNDLDFNLFFSNPVELRELNEDWDIISNTPSRIVLSDDDDNVDEDVLIFEKF